MPGRKRTTWSAPTPFVNWSNSASALRRQPPDLAQPSVIPSQLKIWRSSRSASCSIHRFRPRNANAAFAGSQRAHRSSPKNASTCLNRKNERKPWPTATRSTTTCFSNFRGRRAAMSQSSKTSIPSPRACRSRRMDAPGTGSRARPRRSSASLPRANQPAGTSVRGELARTMRALMLSDIRFVTADQLDKFLRMHLMAVRAGFLLRHRALGTASRRSQLSFAEIQQIPVLSEKWSWTAPSHPGIDATHRLGTSIGTNLAAAGLDICLPSFSARCRPQTAADRPKGVVALRAEFGSARRGLPRSPAPSAVSSFAGHGISLRPRR